ncbi:MAG TPA: hypothetical protein V6C86_18025 [Oculatellaceae cyanobacterium]
MTTPNQPTDQSHGDKPQEKPNNGLNARHSGFMDHDALEIIKHHHHHHKHHHHHLHHVDLHGQSEPSTGTAIENASKPAEQHAIKRGETLSQIAKEAIGAHATNHEIYDLVNKIVDANKDNQYLKSADKIIAGGVLTIPEHISHVPSTPSDTQAPGTQTPNNGEVTTPPPASPKDTTVKPGVPADSIATPGQPLPTTGDAPIGQQPTGVPKAGDAATPAQQQPTPGVNQAEIEADARALNKALGWFTDKDKINKILEGKTDAERKAIAAQYMTNNGISLDADVAKHLIGTDLEKFRNILNRQDNNAASQNADRIHEDLSELQNMFKGRSNSEIEKDIRQTLASHNSDQIKQMEAEYTKAHPGQTLQDAIANDPKLSQTTKDMAKIYLNHSEANSDQESHQLIDIALKSKNVDCFNEVMANASQGVRDDFMKNGGEQKIKDSFGGWFSGNNVEHALDFAKEGKLDAATQVQDNHHLFNNNEGIELAIKQMTPSEREMYQNGKLISEGKQPANLSGDDATKASQYYERLHTAMTNTGNSTDVSKWEDEISTTSSKGSFASSLADDRHWYGNAGIDTIQQQMRSMSQSDWQDCKQNPGRRDEVVQMLQSLGKSEDDIKKTMAVYDGMMSSDTYDHAKDGAKQSVLDGINNSKHWYGNNRDGILDSIQNMSQADQNSYRTNAEFRQKVDAALKDSIEDVDGQSAAQRMLDAIKAGKSPQGDIITTLQRLQNYDGSKTKEAVKDIEEAMKADPTLKDRILHDQQFGAQFKAAVQNAFGDDYDNFGKPFVEQGDLPLDMKMHLAQDGFSNDNQLIYSSIAQASPEERNKLANDANYRQQVIGFLSEDRQQIVLAVAAQGEVRPEDTIRDASVGWGGSSDIVSALKGIKPEDLNTVKEAYAQKYGVALEADLSNKLSGTDKNEAERILTQNLDLETRVNIAKDQTENTRSGIGAAISDHVFNSATGSQADNSLDQTTAALADKNKMDKAIADGTALAAGMSPEQQQALQAQLTQRVNDAIESENTATDNHAKAKAAAAEYVSDGAIAAVAIGSIIVTGGADAPLVLALAAAGAGIKVGTNATMEGNDYDWSAGNVAKDALTGSVTAATSVIGPGEVAAVFGIGKEAAEGAAAVAINEVGANALREGGQKIIENGAKDLVREALASGAKKLDAKAFTELAEKAISPEIQGAAREEAVAHLATSLQEQVVNRMAKGVVARAQQQALNMAGGGMGGGAGGVVQGATEWDSRKGVGANFEHIAQTGFDGTLSGAVGGGVMTAGMEGLGTVVRAGRESTVIRQGLDTIMNRVGRTGVEQAEATATDAVEHALKVPGRVEDVPPNLTEGKLKLASESNASSTHADVRSGTLTHADGTIERVFYHANEITPEDTAARLTKEQAGAKLNRMFNFSGRYPESEVVGASVSGHPGEGWLQEAAGAPLEGELKRRAIAQFGSTTNMDQDVAKILQADPKLAHNIEEAVVERVVYGDADIGSRNLGVTENGVRNFDLGEGFHTNTEPEISSFQQNLTTIGLQNAMSGREISADIKTKLSDFLQHYDNPTGMDQLRTTGLNDEQINAMLSRTRKLVETGKLPEVDPKINAPDNVEWWRAAERSHSRPAKDDIKLNKNGRVSQVNTEEGTATFQYFKRGPQEGTPKSVKLADGTKYSTTDGENWTVTGPEGKSRVKGSMTVDKDGNASFKDAEGVTTTHSIDGRHTRLDDNGNRMVLGKDGHIDAVGDNRGRVALYDYSADGQLSRIQRADGSTLERVGDVPKTKQQQWILKDKANPDGRVIQGETTFNRDGSVDIKTSAGRETISPNGSSIERDAADHVTRVVDRDGKETNIKYDSAGKVRRVDGPDFEARKIPQVETDAQGRVRSVTSPPNNAEIRIDYQELPGGETSQSVTLGRQKYTSTDGENWKVTVEGAPTMNTEWKGKIKIADDGTVSFKADGSRTTMVHRPDGVTVGYDGYQIETVRFGKDDYERLPDGTWEKNGQGEPLHGFISDSPKDGLVFENKNGPAERISNRETWESYFHGEDKQYNTVTGPITVDADGRIKIPTTDTYRYYDEYRYTDGSTENRVAMSDNLVGGHDNLGQPLLKQRGQLDDFHESVHDRFDFLWSQDRMDNSVRQVSAELKDVRTVGPGGKETSVYDSLMSDTTLSDRAKANVLENLARVREHFASYRLGDRIHGDPEVNWIHTQGELGRVLESARANKLTSNEMEDAMLASMYSDSVKFGNPPPAGAKANFFTHHLDGAFAAEDALSKAGFPKERIDGIVQAIKEHQVAPPEFMGGMYYNLINGEIDKLAAAGTVSSEKISQMRATLQEMSESTGSKRVISGIAHVNDVPKVQGPDGSFEVAFTDQQKELLKLGGIDRWSVPEDPHARPDFKQLPKAKQEALMSQYKVSQTLIDGDAIDNYATLGGASKIVALRRPGGWFPDKTVWGALESVDDSFKDAYNVMSKEGKSVADANLLTKNHILHDEQTGIKAQMDEWLRSQGLDPATQKIPYYNTDLKYPKQLTAEEKLSLSQGVKADGSPLTDADREALKFKGLTRKEIQQFKTAQDISDHMRDLLRRANRLDHSLPEDFKPGYLAPSEHWTPPQPEKFQIPEVYDQQFGRNGWSGRTADGLGIMGRKDGSVTVSDTVNHTVRTYDKNGNITEAIDGVNRRTFSYDAQGDLVKVQYPDGVSLVNEDGYWSRQIRQGTYSRDEMVREEVQAQPNGDIRYVDKNEKSVKLEHPDGSVERLEANGRRDWIQADLANEKAKFDGLLEKSYTNPKQLERVQKLMSEFEAEADKHGFYDNKRALFYKQINRLLADDPNAVVPQAQRAALAEQVINHAAHPSSVDQGTNGTCNVTTLEVRNYVRDPEKNAQLIADIATNGQFTAADGHVIDLRDLQAGIHPDSAARKNMRLQAELKGPLKEDGTRDFASQLTELGMANAKWQTTSTMIMNGREVHSWNLVYDADNKIVGTLKDRSKVTQLYAKDHTPLTRFREGDVAYTKSGKEIKDLDPEKMLYRNGQLLGTTDDGNLNEVFTATGGRLQNLDSGTQGFDKDGKEILKVAGPGELRYDKELGTFGEKERVYYRKDGEWKPLADADGDIMKNPNIYGSELEDINRNAVNTVDSGYYIEDNQFSSVELFEKHLALLKEGNDFPAVAAVFTGNAPFANDALAKAWGSGGYHVVNIRDYDPETHTIYFSNQWGSAFDHMERGVPAEQFFNGMRPTKLAKYLHDHNWQRYLYQGTLATAGAAVVGGTLYVGGTKVVDMLKGGQNTQSNRKDPPADGDE